MTTLNTRAATLVIIAAAIAFGSQTVDSQVTSPCGNGINPVVCENLNAGDPASVWDVGGLGDASIQGFTTDISVDQGGTVRFKVKTDAPAYRLDIYRMGYYGGMGARKVATVTPSVSLPQTQPACLTQSTTGLVDCGNWSVSASWPVPLTAASGIYFARAVRTDNGGASHIFFIVRDDDGQADVLFQTSDTTWQAYNTYGGNSLYAGAPVGRAYKVSYNRPIIIRSDTGGGQQSWVFNAEYPMVRWLEANGYNVSYTTGVDTDRRGAELLEHKVFLSVGHDEYWSGQQRANVEAARDAGVNLAFLSGNDVFWKTRWESSIDGAGVPYRTLVSYKETHANAKIDPNPAWTGTWRDPRFSPPADGGRAENALSGTLFTVNGTRNDPMTVGAAEGKHRFWRNTSVAALSGSQTATFGAGLLGYEWNEDLDNGFRPAGLQRLSSTTINVNGFYIQDFGSNYGNGTATHALTLYRAPSGALVFSAGTVQYSWGLDGNHDRLGPAADVRLQQATVNLLADMGVQASSLQAGLVGAAPSLDNDAPVSTITAPAAGAILQSGTPVTISGTAAESGGGVIMSVEVSTDDGATWHRATGRSSWTYSWTPFGPGASNGTATLRSRAVDDSGNIETPAAGITVTLTPNGGLVASYGFNEGSGTAVGDASGGANAGTVTGATWATGRFGQALSFDGVDDWVTVNDSAGLDLTNAMTVEAWVRPTTLSGWRSVLLKETTGNLVYGLYANDNVPRPAMTIRMSPSDFSAPGDAPVPLNAWTHLAGTYDGTTIRLYVNGTQVSTLSAPGAMAPSTSPLRIGGNAIWGEHFAGLIDEVRIYRRALSAAEIVADMDTPVGGGSLPDTTTPTVTISAPAAGAVVAGTATVTAAASDNVGVVGVQFLLDGSPLGPEDVAAPYSAPWATTSVSDGSHTLSARARDAAGNIGVAPDVPVTVNNTPDGTPPTVAVSAPAAGATVMGVTTISATAADNVAVAGVTFFLDGNQLGAEDLTAPYSVSWTTTTATNGSHALTARARDGAGNTATSSAVTVTVANTATPAGLVAAYAFDEGAGATTSDASGSGNTGTISGATWAGTGRFGSALSFNGTSSWVTVNGASSLDLTTGMTLEAWVFPAAAGGWRTVMLKEAPSGLAYGLYSSNGNSRPEGVVHVGGQDLTSIGPTALPLNTWTHLAVTHDGSVLRLYVNGVQVAAPAVTGSLATSTGPLRIGGNSFWGEYFSGRIDEVRIYSRVLAQAEIQADMDRPVAASVDTTPPTVSISAPLAGAVVIGTVTVSASASDPSGIAGVQFKVDGQNVGSEDTVAPYQSWWNSGALANGTHIVTATARDNAGNTSTSSPITVTVANPADPASVGGWSAPFDVGIVAVNMALMHTGKVLMYPGNEAGGTQASIFDPATGTVTPTPNATTNIFRSGVAMLADGRLLVAGGQDQQSGALGSAHASVFDPVEERWISLPDMAHRRWSPTVTTLPDGRMLVTSGATTCETCIANVPEVFNPVNNTWTQLTSGAQPAVPYYPFMYVLPNGLVLNAGSTDTATFPRTLNVATQTWATVHPGVMDGGSSVMYLPGKVMQSGTASRPSFAVKPAQSTTAVLDLTLTSPSWRETAPMAYPRAYHNLVILPDGSIVAIGGETATDGADPAKAVNAAERWSPSAETWMTMASGQVPRLYRSTALLLPDGRVLVAGSGDLAGAPNQTTGEYYSPAYLFRGARPTITSAPSVVDYASTFFVATPDAAGIASVSLVRTGAPTHGFDENQRFVPLTFTVGAGGLNVQAPASTNLAPPGHYMLFIVNSDGVPSVAPFVRFAAPFEDPQPPSAPSSLVATGSLGAISLTWSAATDNFGVTGYNLHRSTTAGFVPAAANRIAQPSGTSYADSGLAAGTYYYVVTARDAAGNVSAPSNQASATATSDTTLPSVSVTAPAAGATVSGMVTVTANASDNIGVAGVQFLMDDAPLGAEDTTAPYSVSWNTLAATNGAHVLSARARDAAGNVATSSTVSVTVSNTAQPAGLIAAYGFEETTGTTTSDATGKLHTGTISGATRTAAGKYGRALSFDGVNDWVTIADANDLDLTNGMTLQAWVRPSALADWNTVIMKEHTATTLAYSLYANDGDPFPAATARINGNDRSATAASALPLNTWTHLAATYDGAVLRLYVNGVQAGTFNQAGTMATSARALRIGGNAVWGEYFSGLIDEVRIYNRALSAAEIQADLNRPVVQ